MVFLSLVQYVTEWFHARWEVQNCQEGEVSELEAGQILLAQGISELVMRQERLELLIGKLEEVITQLPLVASGASSGGIDPLVEVTELIRQIGEISNCRPEIHLAHDGDGLVVSLPGCLTAAKVRTIYDLRSLLSQIKRLDDAECDRYNGHAIEKGGAA